MNQIHEDDWGEESWSRHSGMFEPASWQDEEGADEQQINDSTRKIVEISRENGYSDELIAELTGLSLDQIATIP